MTMMSERMSVFVWIIVIIILNDTTYLEVFLSQECISKY
jgi:hypothetical protein